MHPQVCNPRSIDVKVIYYHEKIPKLPPTCPCIKNAHGCYTVPTHPAAFGEFCVRNKLGIEDAVAMNPAWVFDLDGKKVGTRSRPWRVSDYTVAYYLAKNPKAMQNRSTGAEAVEVSTRKRKLEDDESGTKRPKTESVSTSHDSVGNDSDVEGEKVDPGSCADRVRGRLPNCIKHET